ncbi:MAG: glycosyltransferase family 4 protein [Hormoscilla sp. GM7CHS1pb]|nr:glycosyltransferase family 4 protein [Hormoscilla sp. GM7CHS1pb]
MCNAKFAYWTAQRVSVIDDGFKPKLVSQGVLESKVVTIANWVDVNFIRPWPQDLENEFRRDNQLDGKFVVLYAGNIALTQGLETAIKAAAKLQQIREIAFVIVGEKSALETLQSFCSTHKADNVLLLPFQPREKLPEMLGAADVGLVLQKERVTDFNLPSKIPVLLASGRAIVGSVPAQGTAAKAIKNSGGGVVVAPEDPQALADQIEKLYHDRDLVNRLGEQGRNYAMAHYSFEQALTQYEAVFAALTEKKPNSLLDRISEGR